MRWATFAAIGALGGALSACPQSADDPPDSGGTAADSGGDTGTANACPTALRITSLNGGIGHLGYSGNTHALNVSGVGYRVAVTECDDGCVNCRFEGPISVGEMGKRCITDPRQTCEEDVDCPLNHCVAGEAGSTCATDTREPCTEDADCGPGLCRFLTTASTPSSASPACVVVYYENLVPDGLPPIRGSINLETGATQFDAIDLRTASNVGNNAAPGYCPVCTGDPQPNDGLMEGTCTENPVGNTLPTTLGQSCDAMGSASVPQFAGVYSNDCAVAGVPGLFLGGSGVGSQTAPVWELSPDSPLCRDGEPCWCGMCEDLMTPCQDSGDCGGTQCLGDFELETVPVLPGPHNCIDDCQWDPEALAGTCMTQDPPNPETGELPPPRPTGCLPAGMGAQIEIPGASEKLAETTFTTTIGGIACVPPVQVPTSNAIIGLPGPFVRKNKYQIDLEFE